MLPAEREALLEEITEAYLAAPQWVQNASRSVLQDQRDDPARGAPYRSFLEAAADASEMTLLMLRDDYDRLKHQESPAECLREHIEKGVKGGLCNLSACQKPGANYFNKSTKRYYCAQCAKDINYIGGRADTMRLYGVALLCELEP